MIQINGPADMPSMDLILRISLISFILGVILIPIAYLLKRVRSRLVVYRS